jgi:hypothetical protein
MSLNTTFANLLVTPGEVRGPRERSPFRLNGGHALIFQSEWSGRIRTSTCSRWPDGTERLDKWLVAYAARTSEYDTPSGRIPERVAMTV